MSIVSGHIQKAYRTAPLERWWVWYDWAKDGSFDGAHLLKPTEAMGYKRIQCAYCDKPAVQVDGHHPYMSGYTQCEDHVGTKPKE